MLAAYRALVSNPDATDDDRRAFWAAVELEFTTHTLADVRRVVESFLTDEPSMPPPDEGDTDLQQLWRG